MSGFLKKRYNNAQWNVNTPPSFFLYHLSHRTYIYRCAWLYQKPPKNVNTNAKKSTLLYGTSLSAKSGFFFSSHNYRQAAPPLVYKLRNHTPLSVCDANAIVSIAYKTRVVQLAQHQTLNLYSKKNPFYKSFFLSRSSSSKKCPTKKKQHIKRCLNRVFISSLSLSLAPRICLFFFQTARPKKMSNISSSLLKSPDLKNVQIDSSSPLLSLISLSFLSHFSLFLLSSENVRTQKKVQPKKNVQHNIPALSKCPNKKTSKIL